MAIAKLIDDTADYARAVQAIIAAGKALDARGWAPATSGNYSVRLADDSIAMTVSGVHKGRLSPDQILRMDMGGRVLDAAKKPSAEADLHRQIYRLFPEARAILHVHSVPGVALSRLMKGDTLILAGYEMLKAFPGVGTHETALVLPMVDNSQDMGVLTAALEGRLKEDTPGYIIRDHGFYVWAESVDRAGTLVEALDHLLQCELEILKVRGVNP
jgi:methylthioribulose-1-phosphate dehydratase